MRDNYENEEPRSSDVEGKGARVSIKIKKMRRTKLRETNLRRWKVKEGRKGGREEDEKEGRERIQEEDKS